MAERNSRAVRAAYLAALIQGLGVTWPVLSGLLLFKASLGAIVGVIEGWGVWQGVYFAFVTGLTIGYGDLAPTTGTDPVPRRRNRIFRCPAYRPGRRVGGKGNTSCTSTVVGQRLDGFAMIATLRCRTKSGHRRCNC